MRNRARGLGASTISASSKIGEGIAAGVIFDVIYVLIFGNAVISAFTLHNNTVRSPRVAALFAVILGVLVPAASAWVAHKGSRWTRPEHGFVRSAADWASTKYCALRSRGTSMFGKFTPAFSRTPTAWDFTVSSHGRQFIKIECASGKYVGGWFAEQSFVSTYPEPHDIYVEVQWHMNTDGSFGERVAGSDGFWYALQPGDVVEWIDPDRLNKQGTDAKGGAGDTGHEPEP